MKLKLIMLVSVFALGFAVNANAGAVADADGDLVPDAFDNCVDLPNGPGQSSNQVDSDIDGYGNACDTDYDDNLTTTTSDFSIFLQAFSGTIPTTETDHDGNGTTTTSDFATFLADFQLPVGTITPGPSGLACAGTVPCTPRSIGRTVSPRLRSMIFCLGETSPHERSRGHSLKS